MPTCKKCGTSFPIKLIIDGRTRNLCNRKYCLTCSPFGVHNTRQLHVSQTKRRQYDRNHRVQKKRRSDRKKKLVEIKGGGCSICSYNGTIVALDFHHIDERTKMFGLTQSNLGNRCWKEILKEAEKTVLLCRNCHAEVHVGMHTKEQDEWQTKTVPMV